MKKILVIGSKGMAGHVILYYLKSKKNFEVFSMARSIEKSDFNFSLDVSDTNKVKTIILENQFDVIVNCIGILNKNAEENPETAIWYNSYFPHFIESITRNTTTKIIHISTDCVFSGEKGSYTENDFKDGIGFYAQSKALGEIINDKDVTIRTSIIGPELKLNGIGLLNWFLNQPENTNLKGFTNAFWTGLTTLELAKVIVAIIEQNIKGLIQVTPQNKISKYNLLKLFNTIYRNDKLIILKEDKYKIDKSLSSIRTDFNYIVPTYKKMLIEQKKWMLKNNNIYKHYSL
ncbi:SDR family oxidoreductase [Flavobacterium sediminilitoris]|uniref:dTDP-4-dehydrorhamnose reductase n=1 Tax=Flavobacterium sediminilitoris TaxID=2024526 RepID=A0ABY4HMF1_9FLAO|nr:MULTISPECIES: SDR family oxidoreductase [Flavobacterium]UOX34031.1 SDR family oxidoreductase [Flavobacterium sediminilitoris]